VPEVVEVVSESVAEEDILPEIVEVVSESIAEEDLLPEVGASLITLTSNAPLQLNEDTTDSDDVDPSMAYAVTDDNVHIAEISDDLFPLRSTSNLMDLSRVTDVSEIFSSSLPRAQTEEVSPLFKVKKRVRKQVKASAYNYSFWL